MSMPMTKGDADGAVPIAADTLRKVLKNLGLGPVAVEPFEWPQPQMSAFRGYCRQMLATVFVKRANTKSFALWLVQIGEDREVPVDRFHILYEEWCCIEGVRPLRRKALEIDIKRIGITGTRPRGAGRKNNSTKQRPTIYTVNRAKICPPLRIAA